MYTHLKESKPHSSPERPFSCYHIHNWPTGFQIPIHWHDEIEFIYIRKGPVHINISGENYTGYEGDIFSAAPGTLHMMSTPIPFADYYTLLFPLSLISFQNEDILEQKLLRPLRTQELQICPYTGNSRELFLNSSNLLDNLIAVQKESELRSLFETRILLLSYLELLYEKKKILPHTASKHDTMEKELLSFIQQNFQNPLTLTDLANVSHLSAKYLSRYFKEHFQLTLSQYIMHLRINHAKLLLNETTLPITEIALQSGFSNVSYFIRTFKKTVGVSPREHRKQSTIINSL